MRFVLRYKVNSSFDCLPADEERLYWLSLVTHSSIAALSLSASSKPNPTLMTGVAADITLGFLDRKEHDPQLSVFLLATRNLLIGNRPMTHLSFAEVGSRNRGIYYLTVPYSYQSSSTCLPTNSAELLHASHGSPVSRSRYQVFPQLLSKLHSHETRFSFL